MPLAMGAGAGEPLRGGEPKKALTQVIGFLMLENGIALLALLGATASR